ncbi:MAG: hypothetical protein HRF43_20605, partial [Phycisphaerae bacterium]
MPERPAVPNASNLAFVEGLLDAYLRDALSVPPEWRRYFDSLADAEGRLPAGSPVPGFKPRGLFDALDGDRAAAPTIHREVVLQERLDQVAADAVG